jgi:predicted metalloprotease
MRQRVIVFVLALAALLAPATAHAQSTVESVVADIDAFWATSFANAGLSYTPPRLQAVDSPMNTQCGPIDPYFSPGAYCAADQTVYYSLAWAPDAEGAELIWFTVLSHEWAHHIQWLTDTGVRSVLESELQADCFAGAYLSHAEEIGLVSPVAVTLALSLTQAAGDVAIFLPDGDLVHGNKAERALAFMTGMNGGLADCGFAG